MCGIAGVVDYKRPPDLPAVRRILKAQRHRGPDHAGLTPVGPCVLGHNRLSVLDASPAAHQPMCRSGVSLTYNGEIYNFQEKRLELERDGVIFQSHSDTEVLLHLYLKYGRGCLKHIRGVYAFAIWDSHDNTLFCARDPLGVRPFLYAKIDGRFIFASELKGLLASGFIPRTVSRQSISALLRRGSVPQPSTMLEEVYWLLPGHALVLTEEKTPEIYRFKVIHENFSQINAPYQEILEQGRYLLKDIVRSQMVADAPLGAFLSGGVDSSLLVALMTHEHGDVRTFSVGFEDCPGDAELDETENARLVAEHLGCKHTSVLIGQAEVLRELDNIARGLDHPTVDGVNSWFVAKAAGSELAVAISGTGGDELFAGYPWFTVMRDYCAQSSTRRLLQRFKGTDFASLFDSQYYIFEEDTARQVCKQWFPPTARPDPLHNLDAINRVSGMLLSGYTRDQLLADIDTAAMWHGLEIRVPLLDESLLEFALSLPDSCKLGPGQPGSPPGSYGASGVKRLLVDMAEPLLPQGFLQRSKRGFSLPFNVWLKGALSGPMHDLLSDDTVRSRAWLNPEAVQAVMKQFKSGTMHWTRPWLLMNLELWAEKVFDFHYEDDYGDADSYLVHW